MEGGCGTRYPRWGGRWRDRDRLEDRCGQQVEGHGRGLSSLKAASRHRPQATWGRGHWLGHMSGGRGSWAGWPWWLSATAPTITHGDVVPRKHCSRAVTGVPSHAPLLQTIRSSGLGGCSAGGALHLQLRRRSTAPAAPPGEHYTCSSSGTKVPGVSGGGKGQGLMVVSTGRAPAGNCHAWDSGSCELRGAATSAGCRCGRSSRDGHTVQSVAILGPLKKSLCLSIERVT